MRQKLICGVDEVGRGAGAGEIYCAAVILNGENPISGITDSKKLSAKKRTTLAQEIRAKATAWCIATASLEEIVELNVLYATMLAMQRAVNGLPVKPDKTYIDGNRAPQLEGEVETVIKGDLKIIEIGAASIIAKVARDEKMIELHQSYPEYGFDQHKGYLTKQHLDALQKHGPCAIHRVTYAPIKRVLNNH
ncbi:RNase HII [Desulfuromusa kysingii]|uniref:Ribonuclease HII n=1 Tax=Desulfuromusa kysingii TaxID=37625 RepID=A0A1H3ZJ37_9BACT|nr:ribonuclease HII [Desulfuromusa kysingii]SEA23743.1 RNase HII [Desulfuromusa kysingii]